MIKAAETAAVTKGYLEPNIVNWARRAGWSGNYLRARLSSRGLTAHFGVHGIYELARGFLSDTHCAEAQENFGILAELEPVVGPTVEILLGKELDLLRTGAAVIPVLRPIDQVSAKAQILTMASGSFESLGRKFIEQREARASRDHPLYKARLLADLKSALASGVERPTSFEDALVRFDEHVPAVIRKVLGARAKNREPERLHARLEEFPLIQTIVRANLYMWAIPFVSGGPGPSADKSDDYRHVIEASYCSVFITGDSQLARTAPRLNPHLSVLTWDALAA